MPRPRLPARLWFKRSEGQWVIRDGAAYIRTGYGAQQRGEAEAALKDYLASRRPPSRIGPAQPGDLTVGEVLARYVDDKGPGQKNPVTLRSCVKALAPFWGNLTCDAIKGATCRRYVAWRAEGQPATKAEIAQGRIDAAGKKMPLPYRDGRHWIREPAGASTARRDLGVLQAALTHAYREGQITQHLSVTLPEAHGGRERWLTKREARRLLKAADKPHLRMFILIALYTGRRAAAITALQWQRNSDGDGWVDLRAGVIRFLGERAGESKKQKGSIRIPRPLLRHLRFWRRRSPRTKHVISWKGKQAKSVRTAFEKLRDRLGMHDVSPHTLKHTAVTWAFQDGMTLEDAADWFATTPETLRRNYRQHSPHHQTRQLGIVERKW